MTSRVSFDIVGQFPVPCSVAYPSIHATTEVVNGSLSTLIVDVDHDDALGPHEIAQRARNALREVVLLLGVGRGYAPVLGGVHIRDATASAATITTTSQSITGRCAIARGLISPPAEYLVAQLKGDERRRRQAECLLAARASSDIVARIRWAYQVLEQEAFRTTGYAPPDDFRHLRNAVSHPEPGDSLLKEFFRSHIGADMPDFENERDLADHKFWV